MSTDLTKSDIFILVAVPVLMGIAFGLVGAL
jgi:nitrate/nitrite transporter NarK